jgi:ribosomal protein S18 acetylase RimI-like enzyme
MGGDREALLRHVFVEFRRRGVPEVALKVDAGNPTGAVRLYERVGMRAGRRYELWRREL